MYTPAPGKVLQSIASSSGYTLAERLLGIRTDDRVAAAYKPSLLYLHSVGQQTVTDISLPVIFA